MVDNADAEKDEWLGKQKEIENLANPIMRNLYSGRDDNGGDDMDFGDDEL